MTIQRGWRPTDNILNFIYQWLDNCWCWRWLSMEPGGHLTIFLISYITDWAPVGCEKVSFRWAWKPPYNIPNFIYHWLGNCWWWRFPFPCSHTHIYRFMYILTVMSNNLVNQSTKAISTNELRWIGPVLAVVNSDLMDLFLLMWCGGRPKETLLYVECFRDRYARVNQGSYVCWLRDEWTLSGAASN